VTALAADPADAEPQYVEVVGLDQIAVPLASGSPSGGMAVDLTAILLKSGITMPSAAVTRNVARDETTSWYVADSNGHFVASGAPGTDAEISMLIRTPVIT
jgi:hypothetical protein